MELEIYNAFVKAGVSGQLATRGDVETVRREVAELKVEMVKWFVGTVIAVGGITAALLKIMH